MTEGDKDSIPPLEDLDQEGTVEMADETEFCSCPGTKTKASIKKNNNKCPNTNCGKKLTDIQGYDTDESIDEPTKSEQQFKIFTDWLEGIFLRANKSKQSSQRPKPKLSQDKTTNIHRL